MAKQLTPSTLLIVAALGATALLPLHAQGRSAVSSAELAGRILILLVG